LTICYVLKKYLTKAYILGMFEIANENYIQLDLALKDLLAGLEVIKEIEIDNVTYNIKMMLGGDLKSIALLFGINCANSNYSCVWCHCNLRGELTDLDGEWKIDRSQSLSIEKCGTENCLGYKHKPLITFIEFDCIVIDHLHLLLRISDQLFDLLQEKLIRQDNNDSLDMSQRKSYQMFEAFLGNDCKITNPVIHSAVNKEMHCRLRSLSGTERLKIFSKIFEDGSKFEYVFANIGMNFRYENYVWKNFYEIYLQIKSFDDIDVSHDTVNTLKSDLKKWLKIYDLLSQRDHITPYIHAFVFHMPEFITKFRKVNLYNVQGLEKLNDLTTRYYHSSTNKQRTGNKYLLQLIEKENRMEFYNLGGQLEDLSMPVASCACKGDCTRCGCALKNSPCTSQCHKGFINTNCRNC
jgi:hypothetical protein